MKTEPTEAKQLLEDSWLFASTTDSFKKDSFRAVNIAFQEGQSNPKIRQLEWEEYRDCLVSTTPFYNVSIKEVCGIYELATAYSAFIKSYNSLDEAKAAAQTDFEKKIKECLE